jgi:hypothetical protein
VDPFHRDLGSNPRKYGSSTQAMDIDDLLAEVAVDSTPRETRDLQDLTRCWVAERVAPEILPWPSDLMNRVLDRIRRQVRRALLLRSVLRTTLIQ